MRDFDAGLFDFRTFPGAGHQDRVSIVYVCVNLSARRRLSQQFKTAIADWQMIHLSRSASTVPDGSKFMVAPECAVEQNDVRIGGRF
jgi:hypothetical protein